MTSAYVIWVDNYNDSWRRGFAKLGRNSYSQNNWTGVALRQGQENIDMSVVKIDGQIVPAMPDDPLLFTQQAVDMILMGSVGPIDRSTIDLHNIETVPSLYDTSLLVAWAPINRVPLKPDPSNKNIPRYYRDVLSQAPDTLGNFHVVGIFEENIGSNEGLASIIKKFYDSQGMEAQDCHRYFAMTADMNIHKRLLRVICDRV